MWMTPDKTTYKRLDRENRSKIEHFLDIGRPLSFIAEELGYSLSTITREVKAHRVDLGTRSKTMTGSITNLCVNRNQCERTDLCTICQRRNHPRCARCTKVRCSTLCGDFIRRVCKTTERSPYVCNSCSKARGCDLHKWRYRALDAQRAAEADRRETRRGIDIDPEKLEAVHKLIRPLLAKGQSPAQIWLTHAHEIPFSRRSFYRYVEQGLFSMTAFDLPKKVRYKVRKSKSTGRSPLKVPPGHTFSDFLELPEEVRETVCEMDTVIGCKEDVGSLLTLHLKRLHFQIGFKLAYHDCAHAEEVIDRLEEILQKRFREVYGLGLCDRGVEFFSPSAFEDSKLHPGTSRMELFYCDAHHSEQKGSAEKAHVEIRKVIPKGMSIDALSDDDIALVFSHINSTPRRSLFGMTPMQLAIEVLPQEFFEELGLNLIPPDEVTLHPSLLK